MAIQERRVEAENLPVKVEEKDGKPVYCDCCADHKTIKMAMIRGSAFDLQTRLPAWFSSLGIKEILTHAQSESDGNLSITITYR